MPGTRPRALLVSWLFPPHGSIGAKRAYRFARHLPTLGWDVTVLCGREPPARLRDPTPRDLPSGVRVVEDYDAAWLTALANRADARAARAPSPLPADSAPSSNPGTRRRLGDLAARVLHDGLPTETIAVHLPHALRAAERLARAERPAVVWTTSYPYSAHVIGLALKRRLGIPFVADLRDPWTLNFVHEGKYAPARWVESRLERAVFSAADAVVVTTEALARAYRERYPAWADRFVAVRNAFDPTPLPPRAPPSRPVRLMHFGHVYGARTLAPVLEALARVRAARSLAPSDVVLENLGRLPDEDRALARTLGVDDLLVVREPLPYLEGLRALRQAHLLLLPAWGTERGALFLPGKLYDYLLAGAPVLAVGHNDELAGILRETGAGELFAPGDVAGIARVLGDALDGRAGAPPDALAIERFSAPRAAELLAAVFASVADVDSGQ